MNLFHHPVVASLSPVFLMVAAGVWAGRRDWVRREAVRDLSNLVFLLLIPALLFRTMSRVHLDQLDLRPIVAYFSAALLLFAASVAWRGFDTRSVVLALGGVFANMVMIGITLIGLAYGEAGLVTLLTLVSVHALTLLSTASVVLELAAARQQRHAGREAPHVLATALAAIRSALIHPIPLPILSGLLFARLGWSLPPVLDTSLQLLGSAFGPVSLVLVGINLARTPLTGHWRLALQLTLSKNLLLPLLVAFSGWAMGVQGLPLTVMIVAAGLPIGANVFLFAQRYHVVEEASTAAMGVSTVLALFTLSAIMLLTR